MKMRQRKKATESIHNIPRLTLPKLNISSEYELTRTLAEGSFARVFLARHRRTNTRVVLKAIHMELTTETEFLREYHYSYHLSPHPNILSVYPVAFNSQGCYVFAQEYAPLGDLAGAVVIGGLPEPQVKKISQQLSSALSFLHSLRLVHRDLKLENVLIFAEDMSVIKLCDFGATVCEGTLVTRHRCTWQSFLPPEVVELVPNERYECRLASDAWQLGIIIFVCMTGCPPWQVADISDAAYHRFLRWQKRKTTAIPAQFHLFTARFIRLLRRLLECKLEKRAPVSEINKYLKDDWVDRKHSSAKTSAIGASSSVALSRKGSLNMYINHDDVTADEKKCRLKKLMSSYGLETTIDQKTISRRVWEWILSCDSQSIPTA